MPGTRLTYEERRRVAEGLAEGLPYAEIARRLGRPRSTVIREVSRNGGPPGYRANQAQQATAWRARRRSPGPHPAVPDVEARGVDPEKRHEYEEDFAELMTRTGVPAMAAKVLVRLFTCEADGLTAAELTVLLQVSPASVSKAVGWLERLGLIARERDGRRERYVIDEHIGYRAYQVSLQSMLMWTDMTRRGSELFGGDGHAGARLRDAGEFFAYISRDMAHAAEHWRQIVAARGRRG